MEGFAKNYRGIAFGVLLALTVSAGAWMVLRFVPAMLWAIVLTVLIAPTHTRLRRKFTPNLAATFAVFGTIALVGIPLALVGTILSLQIASWAKDFAAQSPNGGGTFESIVTQLDGTLHPLAERIGASNFHLQDWFGDNKDAIVKGLTGFAATAARSTGETLFTLVVAFLTMFFLLRDGHRLREPALELIPLSKEKAEEILAKMGQTIHAVFIGVVLVALIQGAMAGIAYWAVGVPSPIVWFVATTVLCAIPLLGAPLIYVPMSLLLLSQGKVWQGCILLAVGFGLVSQIDNILRPWVIGARTNLHPMAIFFSLLGGVFALGPVGIMAGPVLLTVLLALQDIVREHNRRLTEAEATDSPAASPS